MKVARSSAAAAALAMTLIGLAACGSSSSGGNNSGSNSGNNGGSSGTVSAPGIVGKQIIVGSVAGPDAPGFDLGIEARIDAFNKAGGVDGLTVKYLGNSNDNDDPNTNLTLFKQLVLQKHVYAALTYPSLMQPAAGAFLASKKVPYIGYGFAPVMCNNPDGFGFNGCTVPGVAKGPAGSLPDDVYFKSASPTLLPSLSGAKIALVGQAIGGADAYDQVFAAAAKASGMDVVYNQAVIPIAGGNVQAFASAVIAAHPDIINLIAGPAADVSMKGQLRQDGYKGVVVDEATYSPSLLASSATADALEGTYSFSQTPTLLDTTPFAKQMVADFNAAGVKEAQIGEGSLVGYMVADEFVGLLKQVSPHFSTFADTVNAGMTYTPISGGIPSTWPASHAGYTSSCVSITKVVNSKFTLAAPFKCYS